MSKTTNVGGKSGKVSKSGLWPGQKSPILVMLRWALAFDMTTLPWQAVYVGGMVLLSKMRGCHFLTHNRTKFAGEQMKLRHLYIYIYTYMKSGPIQKGCHLLTWSKFNKWRMTMLAERMAHVSSSSSSSSSASSCYPSDYSYSNDSYLS